MSVPYLQAGDAILASQLNALFGALDAKLTAGLSGKSHLLLGLPAGAGATAASFFGKPFYFVNGAQNPVTKALPDYTGSAYDHAYYQTQANAAASSSWDDARHIVTCNTLPAYRLDGSMQAHWRYKPGDASGAHYYLKCGTLNPWAVPEKKYSLAVAELIFDGMTSKVISSTYDKYHCFRIHNLNYTASVTVSFAGGPTLVVPPLGVRTVRRSVDGTNYHTDYHYFFQCRPGDMTFYNCMPAATLFNAMAANNVCNPAMLLHWLQALVTRCGFDWSVTAPEFAAASQFGDPAEDTTLFGDLLHHHGKIIIASKLNAEPWTFTDLEFAGHATLATDFAAAGLTVGSAGGAVTVQETRAGRTTDLITLGTNLFKQGSSQRVAFNINTAVALETGPLYPGAQAIFDGYGLLDPGTGLPSSGIGLNTIHRKVFADDAATAYYQLWDGSNYVVYPVTGRANARLVSDAHYLAAYQPLLAAMLADLKVMDDANVPDTDYGKFNKVTFAWKPCGPTLSFEERVLPVGDVSAVTLYGGTPWVPMGLHKDGYFTETRYFTWPGNGFDCLQGEQSLNCGDPRFYTGRQLTQAGTPNVAAGIGGGDARLTADGKDFVITKIEPYVDTSPQHVVGGQKEISIQQVLTAYIRLGCYLGSAGTGLVLSYSAPDWLDKFTATDAWYAANRANLIASNGNAATWGGSTTQRQEITAAMNSAQYNLLAWCCNAWRTFRPLSLDEILVSVTTEYGEQALSLGSLAATAGYPKDSGTVVPRGHWRSWNRATSPYAEEVFAALCAKFGIPIRGEADLPAGYAANKNQKTQRRTLDLGDYRKIVHWYSVGGFLDDPPGTSHWFIHTSLDYLGPGAVTSADAAPVTYPVWAASYGADYRWLRHADILARATALGLPFHHCELVTALKLAEIGTDPAAPGLVIHSGMTQAAASVTHAESDPDFDYTAWYWVIYGGIASQGAESDVLVDAGTVSCNVSPGFVNAATDGEWEWDLIPPASPVSTWDRDDGDASCVIPVFVEVPQCGPWDAPQRHYLDVWYYPDSRAEVAAHQHYQRLGAELSSHLPNGTAENRVLFSPQHLFRRTKDYSKTHSRGPGGSPYIVPYAPATYAPLTDQAPGMARDLTAGGLVALPPVADPNKPALYYHVYLRSAVVVEV